MKSRNHLQNRLLSSLATGLDEQRAALQYKGSLQCLGDVQGKGGEYHVERYRCDDRDGERVHAS